MNKLIFTAIAAAVFTAGAPVLAQDAEQQAGSAWRTTPDTNLIPGTPEYHGNSGWTPPHGYVRRNGTWVPGPQYRQYNPAPAYPYVNPDRRSRRDRDRDGVADRSHRRDRDGDGVANRSDRHPDNPYRH